MADLFASLGGAVDGLLVRLGVHGVTGLDAGLYVLGAAIFLGFLATVPSAVRLTLLRRSPGK